MPVSHASRGESYQPFQCIVCQSRFTRHENLKRHAALHSRSQKDASLPCEFCHATFSRPDLRHRHMKRKHPEYEQKRSKRLQCDPAHPRLHSVSPAESPDSISSPRSGNANVPDQAFSDMQIQPSAIELMGVGRILQDATGLERSLLLGTSFLKTTQSLETQLNPISVPRQPPFDVSLADFNFNQDIVDRLSPSDLPLQDGWYPSTLQVTRGCHLFFSHIAHFVPFLHQSTFDSNQSPSYLIVSILCLAYQYGEDSECGEQAGSGADLSMRCFHRARSLIASEEGRSDILPDKIPIVQSYVLLQICAMMYLCGESSAFGLKIHSSMISLARASGMMQPLAIQSATPQDLESLWREFVKGESHKRTVFAVHQIDALWYQFLSVPRSISHLEVKHDLPCPEEQWTASSSAEWAHRQLVMRSSGPSVQYADAVRRFLSAEDLNSIPQFDPYGAINITQFLISSAREISGWSTMTGIVSMERFGALRSSLVALSPFIRPHADANLIHGALCTATWETAMLELQMWSPSHTGGIVEGSIDAVLTKSTYLAPDCEFLCENNAAKAIQPHVDWFLRYLDSTLDPDTEAPWIALYAYKAFLIALQLVRKGLVGAMQVVGIRDGDVQGALMWARKVFQRRQRWQLGRLIISCLDELET
ncbi:hypothetical protein N7476_001376 [Penicillium atrosanguineum]|uniref:C2H2-type domain-containing protein n=1 Tax=Penicillium atrosanguineum TaxID=1132637 RepID=A0A9W9UD18_9EURO|nr:hypothetical protein N7526_000449 [Penicillium atrosanguineum]KAJ5331593.1 hypothetical protein N7476_001376 [Penicillium atrosanguineum]